MSLPLVVDVAIGLLFIYLTLSLLASEIQELLTTILQWRAEHLKKSVEILLKDETFADRLYQSPLIKALNQEGKGPFSEAFRRISYFVSDIYHRVTQNRNVFGNERSGPSYIPAATFSVALLQQINLGAISEKISVQSLKAFKAEKLAAVQDIVNALRNSLGDYTLLDDELTNLDRNLDEVLEDFANRRATLPASIQQLIQQIQQFLENTESWLADHNHCKDIIRSRLPYIKQAVLKRRLDPTVAEVLMVIFNELEGNNGNYAIAPRLKEIVDVLKQDNPELFERLSDLPDDLKKNLIALAEHAQFKVDSLEDGIRQMEQEVAIWFDNSMARASGVYRRNAKGIAILIGCIIAVVLNADSFYIANRLSKDTALRSTISQAGDQLIAQDSLEIQTNLESLKNAVDGVLDEIPLPIGWSETNTAEQMSYQGVILPAPLRRIFGWLVSGIALSMGASFWYDLLGKIVRVRTTGRMEKSD